jgi:hypothetical protein
VFPPRRRDSRRRRCPSFLPAEAGMGFVKMSTCCGVRLRRRAGIGPACGPAADDPRRDRAAPRTRRLAASWNVAIRNTRADRGTARRPTGQAICLSWALACRATRRRNQAAHVRAADNRAGVARASLQGAKPASAARADAGAAIAKVPTADREGNSAPGRARCMGRGLTAGQVSTATAARARAMRVAGGQHRQGTREVKDEGGAVSRRNRGSDANKGERRRRNSRLARELTRNDLPQISVCGGDSKAARRIRSPFHTQCHCRDAADRALGARLNPA